jgi:hypothetical protein
MARINLEPSTELVFKISHLLFLFSYDHLPEDLQQISSPFYDLAHHVHMTLGNGEFTYESLKALKVAKDWAVNQYVLIRVPSN